MGVEEQELCRFEMKTCVWIERLQTCTNACVGEGGSCTTTLACSFLFSYCVPVWLAVSNIDASTTEDSSRRLLADIIAATVSHNVVTSRAARYWASLTQIDGAA